MSDIANQLERQCEIVAACEALDAAASHLTALGETREALDLWRLPVVTRACAAAACAQAAALQEWAEGARQHDALLSRELRRAADALVALATAASRAAGFADEFATSEAPDDWLAGAAAADDQQLAA